MSYRMSLLAGIFLGALQTTALAQEASTPVARKSSFEIMLPLVFDGRYAGDISVRIADGVASFDSERFFALVGKDISQEARDAITAKVVNGRLSPEAASISTVAVSYDQSAQEIRVVPAMSARTPKVISSNVYTDTDKYPLSRPAPFALFLNGALTYQHIWKNDIDPTREGRAPLVGVIDAGGRFGRENGIAFTSGLNYYEDAIAPVTRKETRLYYDDFSRLIRATVGDVRSRGVGFQSVPTMGGISIERYFGLEPSKIFRPVSNTYFDLESASTVEVRMNGITVRNLILQPGRYNMRDIPYAQGANDLELVIRDKSGREQVITSRNFFDFNLLADGVSDFSFAGGKISSLSRGYIHYDGNYAASGFYRRGLSDTVTAGVDVQADEKGGTVGVGTLWASPVGVFRVQGAYSNRSTIGDGAALDLGYALTGNVGNGDWKWSGQVNGRMQTAFFSGIGDVLDLAGNPIQVTAWSVDNYFQISNAYWAFTSSFNYERGRGTRPDRLATQLGVNHPLKPNLMLSSFVRYADDGIRKETGIYVQLRWKIGPNRRIEGAYYSGRDAASVAYSFQPADRAGVTAYDIKVRREGVADTAGVTGNLRHIGSRFEAQFFNDFLSDSSVSGSQVHTSQATIASAIVFAGGRFALSRPIRDGGFAIVEGHETLRGKDIHVEPGMFGDRGRSGALGPAVVPDIGNFMRVPLRVEVDDLPAGYDLGSGLFVLKPPYNAGYRLIVGSDATLTVMGRVLDSKGVPLSLIGGNFTALDDKAAEPIPAFTNRTGRLVASGLKPGKYRLTLLTEPVFTTEVEVSAKSGSLVDLGEVNIGERRVTAP